MAVNEAQFEKFTVVYRAALVLVIAARPEQYPWYDGTQAKLDSVTSKMLDAFRKGTANKDGPACKLACQALGIAHTYQAINKFIGRTS